MQPTSQQLSGRANEQLARQHLEQQGLRHVESNYHCRRGEIDLIMRDHDSLVFVEVRYRRSDRYGSAMESVTFAKQQKLIATARHYLQVTGTPLASRFDVVAISGETASPRIEWVKNAFGT